MNTLGLLLSGCVTAIPDACDKLFDAATPPGGTPPADTLQAARNIARHPWHNADKLFGLLDDFYPVPEGKRYRDVALIPYLFYAPSAWTLSLVYAGGGFYAVGGAAIDVEATSGPTTTGCQVRRPRSTASSVAAAENSRRTARRCRR